MCYVSVKQLQRGSMLFQFSQILDITLFTSKSRSSLYRSNYASLGYFNAISRLQLIANRRCEILKCGTFKLSKVLGQLMRFTANLPSIIMCHGVEMQSLPCTVAGMMAARPIVHYQSCAVI
jgi:hypothetical protein